MPAAKKPAPANKPATVETVSSNNPEPVKGPASYFPSIEKKYGQPISHWQNIVRANLGLKHMEIVNLLKTEHAMGHGHANAVVAYVLAEQQK
jgi:Domain of unknown function (DUF4287)